MVKNQVGMTLIELTITLAIISIIGSFFIPKISASISDSKIRGGVAQAKELVAICNLVRVTPISTSRDAITQQVTKFYDTQYANWTDVALLKNKLSAEYFIPTENPFGRPYYFKMTARSCVVAVELEESIEGWEGYELENFGSRTRIIVSAPVRKAGMPGWVLQQNRLLSGEDFR